MGHATHPDWRLCTELVLAQIEGAGKGNKASGTSNVGLLYISDAFAENASEILTLLKTRTGVLQWVGGTGMNVFASTAEYVDEAAICLMLAHFPVDAVHVFSPLQPLPHLNPLQENSADFIRLQDGALISNVALIHADARTQGLETLLHDVAARLHSGDIVGGILSARELPTPSAPQFANITLSSPAPSLSGAVFSSGVDVRLIVSHGCYPMKPAQMPWKVLSSTGNQLTALARNGNAHSAFVGLLKDLGLMEEHATTVEVDSRKLNEALAGGVFLSITPPKKGLNKTTKNDADQPKLSQQGRLRDAGRVIRGMVGIDPRTGTLVVGGDIAEGSTVQFCRRNAQAAKTDLIRACTELREEFEEESLQPKGIVMISCVGRGHHLFGERGYEQRIVQKSLGGSVDAPIPLVGFAANGEIAGTDLHGFTTVLAVFF